MLAKLKVTPNEVDTFTKFFVEKAIIMGYNEK